MNDEIRITFHNGEMRFIYTDALADLVKDHDLKRARASEVEPADDYLPDAPAGSWIADMKRSGGPLLGPFATKQAALDAEVEWLRLNRGL